MCHCVLLHHLRSALFLFLLLLCHRIVIVFGLSIFAFIFLLFIFLSCISQSCCICIKKNSHATKSWTFVIRSLSTRFAVSVVFFFFSLSCYTYKTLLSLFIQLQRKQPPQRPMAPPAKPPPPQRPSGGPPKPSPPVSRSTPGMDIIFMTGFRLHFLKIGYINFFILSAIFHLKSYFF